MVIMSMAYYEEALGRNNIYAKIGRSSGRCGRWSNNVNEYGHSQAEGEWNSAVPVTSR